MKVERRSPIFNVIDPLRLNASSNCRIVDKPSNRFSAPQAYRYMTKKLHRLILRMLPGPLLGWLGTLMFLLLMQFLIRYLPDIAGRGLPVRVIVELVAYNLAYMIVLAVPMSMLIAALMTFGRLAEVRAYVVIKNAGISPLELIWPTLLVGLCLAVGMVYFNNEVLPEANFRARNLWRDIRHAQPGFELRPGIFYDGLNNYSILVQDIPPETSELIDVLIYDYTEGARNQTVIKASHGHMSSIGNDAYAVLELEKGEIHRLMTNGTGDIRERYERSSFQRLRLQLDLSDFAFERSDLREGYRSDRTTRTADMIRLVDSLEASLIQIKDRLYDNALRLTASPPPSIQEYLNVPAPAFPYALATLHPKRAVLQGLDAAQQRVAYDMALRNARTVLTQIDDARSSISWEAQRADRYRVEIHKKYSIALACLIFSLIGAPLGLSIRRGGLGAVGALATCIFLFYWVTLVQGEKFADREFLTPWIGMWAANIVMLALGLWLMVYVTLDLRATPPLRERFRVWIRNRRQIDRG